MSQQLQITGGAKVRDLQDVIIGTSGVLSSLAFNVANGVPKLDVNGKILVSQLPNSVMEYQGTWNAATNTPTLVNGTGNQGDVYLCNVAGTTNFGAGPITFAVGDSAIYSGTIWQRAGGATGTVTSVGLTSTGNDAITITGSPITTSGNINLGFAGTNLQYINGAGDLTTFPTLISSIGLSMPSAFSVANSPLTSNGTIAVTGAGVASQYIRGDGTLADFPTSGGGGSSVSYYLNGGTSQGTIGGVTYYEMSKTADTGTMADFSLTGNGFIVAFLTDAGDPAQLNIPAGNWNYEIYASMSANGGTPEMYAELYKYDGTTFTLIATSPHEILYDGTALNLYTFAMTVPSTTLAITDRLAVKLYATNSGGKTTTVHTQDSHLCQIITTFSTGITALNGLTAQVQYFATGTSGTDFNISSSTATHTFNIPDASASARGLITTGMQTIAGSKTFSSTTLVNTIYIDGVSYLKNLTSTSYITGYTTYSAKANGVIEYFFPTSFKSVLDFNDAADYTYTFPAASGTISLLESTQTFSGTNTFGFIKADNGVLLKNGVVPASTGYTGIGAGIGTGIDITMSGSIYTQSLYFQTSAAYIYTFPSASGTLALLEGTQTFSGNKTFTALTSFTFSSGTRMDYGPYLTKGSVPTVFSGTTTNIYSDATTNNIVIRDNSSIAKLEFNNSTQTFTFPAATGTLALLSGTQTFTGTTTFSSDITVNGVRVGKGASSVAGNTVVGQDALISNTGAGTGNTAIGYASLNANTSGGANTGIGNQALVRVTTGSYNIGIGFFAGENITTGNHNTIIGNYAGTAGMVNNIVLADGLGNIRYQWDGTSNNFDGILKSSGALWVNTSAGSPNSMIILAQVAGTQPPTLGNSSIGVNTTDFRFTATTTSTNFKSFSFSTSSLTNNSVRTYSMPDADGTLALTSSLAGYLPLTGGTLTGGLYINPTNTATVGLDVASNTTRFRSDNLEGFKRQLEITMGSGTLVQMTAKGFGADYGTDLAFYTATTGGVNASPAIYITGTNNRVGIKTGTPAYDLDVSGTFNTTSTTSLATSSGYVGLGIAVPTNLLCVSKSLTGEAIALIANTSSTGFGLAINSGGGTRYALAINDYAGTAIARFLANGNVGIGITNPGEKFVVQTTANNWTGNFVGNTTSGQSLGLLVTAGTTAADAAFYVQNTTGSFNSFKVRGDGWLVSPTTYNNTSGVAANVGIDSAGNIFRATSSIKYKTDIKPYDKGLDTILLMNPIYYKSKSDFDGDKQFAGFIAEEIHELGLNEFVQYNDENNEPEGLNYGNITAILVKAVQELSAQNQDLKSRLDNAGL